VRVTFPHWCGGCGAEWYEGIHCTDCHETTADGRHQADCQVNFTDTTEENDK